MLRPIPPRRVGPYLLVGELTGARRGPLYVAKLGRSPQVVRLFGPERRALAEAEVEDTHRAPGCVGFANVESHDGSWMARRPAIAGLAASELVRPLAPEIALGVVAQAARRIGKDLHCDVVPKHLVVGFDGRVHVIDPAAAHGDERASDGGRTGFRPPAASETPPDVFGLALCLLWMLESRDPVPLERLARGIVRLPAPLRAVVERAVSLDPKKRIRTPFELAERLEALGPADPSAIAEALGDGGAAAEETWSTLLGPASSPVALPPALGELADTLDGESSPNFDDPPSGGHGAREETLIDPPPKGYEDLASDLLDFPDALGAQSDHRTTDEDVLATREGTTPSSGRRPPRDFADDEVTPTESRALPSPRKVRSRSESVMAAGATTTEIDTQPEFPDEVVAEALRAPPAPAARSPSKPERPARARNEATVVVRTRRKGGDLLQTVETDTMIATPPPLDETPSDLVVPVSEREIRTKVALKLVLAAALGLALLVAAVQVLRSRAGRPVALAPVAVPLPEPKPEPEPVAVEPIAEEAATTLVTIEVVPADAKATLRVDGVEIPADAPIEVGDAPVQVEVTASGYSPARVSLAPGEAGAVRVELRRP